MIIYLTDAHTKVKSWRASALNILRYTHIFYFVFTWIYALIFIKPKRMKELFPVAVISMMILFLVDKYIISLGLYQFNNPVVNILDILYSTFSGQRRWNDIIH